jgi:hypothetical protein
LKALARQGAAQRYQELQAELAALTATFPELARGGKRRAAAPPSAATRRRRSMNAAQRKEVSERMTRYWAARRGEKTDGGSGTAAGKGKGRRRKAAKKAAE